MAEVGAALVPGHWAEAEAFGSIEDRRSGYVAQAAFPPEQLTVGNRLVEVRGFIESGSSTGGRGTVVFLSPWGGGFCVANAWRTPPQTSFAHLVLVSTWRARDGREALVLLQASSRRSAARSSAAFVSVVLATDGTHVRKVFEREIGGLAFDPQPGTVALLGSGEPLYLDHADVFRPLPRSMSGAKPARTCPKTANGRVDAPGTQSHAPDVQPDTWLPGDEAARLYERWGADDGARVAFRRLLSLGAREVEVVGIEGAAATVAFLALTPAGFCVSNSWYQVWGGNGMTFGRPRWWRSSDGRRAVLLIDVRSSYHHGAGSDDPRDEEQELALAFDGVVVRDATSQERNLASAVRQP